MVSCDVYEHVYDLASTFNESYRVLKKDGKLLFTIPFYHSEKYSTIRTEKVGGQTIHYKEPQYHGNPVSDKGSLVVHDFGWDIVSVILGAGFEDVYANIVYRVECGYLGMTHWKGVLGLPLYFIAKK